MEAFIMSYQISIIISSFQRPHLLKWNLFSLARQTIPLTFETIVLNDGLNDETEIICRKYREKLNLKYIFTGGRNLDGKLRWRVPGFVYNIGAQQSEGAFMVLSCAEMFHCNDTISQLVNPLFDNPKFLGIPIVKNAPDDSLGDYLNNHNGQLGAEMFNSYFDLNAHLPYLIAFEREQFFSIGGYDEDFTGICADDDDLVGRLGWNGCQYYQTQAKAIHLYHRKNENYHDGHPDVLFNRNLYDTRRGSILRNQNREWGKL
jgi:glycosyltransferase involved in cell wall biosynthesis